MRTVSVCLLLFVVGCIQFGLSPTVRHRVCTVCYVSYCACLGLESLFGSFMRAMQPVFPEAVPPSLALLDALQDWF